MPKAQETNFLDEAPEVQLPEEDKVTFPIDPRQATAQKIIPEKGKSFGEWTEAAIKGLPEGPVLDYVPIAGPLYTKSKGAATGKSPLEMKKELEEYEQKYPESAAVKSVLGPLSLAAVPEMAGVVGGTGMGAAALRTALSVAENMGISGLDAYLRDKTPEQIQEEAKSGGLLSFLFRGVPEIGAQAAKGVAHVGAGIKPETMEYYRANRELVNKAEPEVVYDDASINLGRAREKLGEQQTKLGEKIQAEKDLLVTQAKNIKEAAKFKASAAEKLGKEKADILTRDVAERMFADIGSARKDISAASSKAFDVLEQAGVQIPITYYKGYLTKVLQSRKIGQKIPATPENIYLYKHRKMLDEIGQKSISAREMKLLIQNLDNEVNAIYEAQRAGQYVSKPEKEIKGLRRMYSERLKEEVPGYREAMQPVATKTAVMNDLERLGFTGSPDKIYNTLMGIEKLNKKDKAEAMARFEALYKRDYRSALAEAKSLREQDYMQQAVPEIARADVLLKSRENVAKKYLPEERRIKSAFDSIRGLTDANIQQALLRYGNNPQKNINLGRRLESLGEMSGKGKNYYTDMAKAVAVKNAFETAYAQGSRLTNLGAMSLAGLAKMSGAKLENIPAFGMLGSIIGATADKLGPQTVKKIVDIVDSPLGKSIGKIYTKAAQRGPQAIIAAHNVLMRSNPQYKKYMEEQPEVQDQFSPEQSDNFLETAPEVEQQSYQEGVLPEIPEENNDQELLQQLLE